MSTKKHEKISRGKRVTKDVSQTEVKERKSKNVNSKPISEITTSVHTIKSTRSLELNERKNKPFCKLSLKMNSRIDGINSDKSLAKELFTNDSNCEKSKICNSCKNSTKIKYRDNTTQLQLSIKSKNCSHMHEASHEEARLKPDVLLYFLDQMRKIVIKRSMELDILKLISEKLIKDGLEVELLLLMDLIIRFQVGELKDIIFKDLLSIEILPENFVKAFLKQYMFLKNLSDQYSLIMQNYETNFLIPKLLSFDSICRAHFKVHLYDSCNEIQDLIDAGHLDVKEDLIIDIDDTKQPDPHRIKSLYEDMKSDFKYSSKWKDVQKSVENILNDPYDISRSLLKYFNVNFPFLSPKLKCKSISCPRHENHQCQTQRCPNHPQHQSYCSHLDQQLLQLQLQHQKNQKQLQSSQNDSNSISKPPVPKIPITINPLMINPLRKPNTTISVDDIIKISSDETTNRSSKRSTINCSSIFQKMAEVKPPSLSSSTSSTTNSNDYNSCAASMSTSSSSSSSSVSSSGSSSPQSSLSSPSHRRVNSESDTGEFDELTDEMSDAKQLSRKLRNDKQLTSDIHHPISRFLQRLNPDLDSTQLNSYTEDFEDVLNDELIRMPNHKRRLLSKRSLSCKVDELNSEDIAFNKLYETYLEDNQHLLTENVISSTSPTKQNDESSNNLKCFLNMLMNKYSQSYPEYDEKITENNHFSKTTFDSWPNIPEDFNYPIDLTSLSLKDDDIDNEYQELSRTILEADSTTINDNLREFEKCLDNWSSDQGNNNSDGCNSKGSNTKSSLRHPNLKALVRKCRLSHNRQFNITTDDDADGADDDNDDVMVFESTAEVEAKLDNGECCDDMECNNTSNTIHLSNKPDHQHRSMKVIKLDKCLSSSPTTSTVKHQDNSKVNDNESSTIKLCRIKSALDQHHNRHHHHHHHNHHHKHSHHSHKHNHIHIHTDVIGDKCDSSIKNDNPSIDSKTTNNNDGNLSTTLSSNILLNNKVCKCCKNEMFGDHSQSSGVVNLGSNTNMSNGNSINSSSNGATSNSSCPNSGGIFNSHYVERLRLKLQQRRKQQTNNNNNSQSKQELPDVDLLVKFINGEDDDESVNNQNQQDNQSNISAQNSNNISDSLITNGNLNTPRSSRKSKQNKTKTNPNKSNGTKSKQTTTLLGETSETTTANSSDETVKLKSPSSNNNINSVSVTTPISVTASPVINSNISNNNGNVTNGINSNKKKSKKKKNNINNNLNLTSKSENETINDKHLANEPTVPYQMKMNGFADSEISDKNGEKEQHVNGSNIEDKKKPVIYNKSIKSNFERQSRQSKPSTDSIEDKDNYDPVVENFKKFCNEMVVVREKRKKLKIDMSLLIDGLEKVDSKSIQE